MQITLFSSVIAALLSVTISDLKQDPQDTSAFYLKSIYNFQVLSDSNTSRPSTPAQPPRFSAPNYAIWVNMLFFMSLCLNLFTAYLLLWTRAILPEILLDVESPQSSPHCRARLRRILADHTLWFRVSIFSLFFSPLLFFAGLSIYLLELNKLVAGPIICCICLCFLAFHSVTNRLGEVSAFYQALYSFVVYAQIMPDSSFIRRSRKGRNHQRGSTTVS
jgi:Family of unknown function (DUF6535)